MLVSFFAVPPSSLTITSNSIDTVLGRSTSQLPTFYVVAGGTLSLLCSATGSPLTFTWYQTNQLLPGETSASLTISSSQMSNAGTYKCLVTNKNVTSSLNFTIPSSKSVEITVIVQSEFIRRSLIWNLNWALLLLSLLWLLLPSVYLSSTPKQPTQGTSSDLAQFSSPRLQY